MIKKLRRKLVAITTLLLTAVLVVILVFMYHSTKTGLEENAWSRLRSAAAHLNDYTRPGEDLRLDARGCFFLRVLPNGSMMAIGDQYYDLDEEEKLRQILLDAAHTKQEQGILDEYDLRFLRVDSWWGMAYVFTDTTSDQAVLNRLNFTSLMILLVGMMSFFIIGVLLARWAVRPVERAWEQQRQFVADASHELKTPLTVILTNAELLQGEEYDADSKEQFASSILTMSRQMRGLVEELLDQARVDHAQAEHRRMDYSRLVSDTVLPFEPVYFEAGRELLCDVEPQITAVGNAAHLRRVVEILLDNGCKYSSPGGIVELRLCRQGKGSLLSVRSPGVAMTAQQCRDIFKRFYRMDQARAMNRSYGLGLSIAQGIVEQHRGKIWAQSQDGYNTFFVSLPQ